MAGARQGAARYPRRGGQPRAARPVREGALGVTELQRSRMLSSAMQVVMEQGYGQMSVARVTDRAGVSRRTFYELFEDREACFLAAFDEAIAEMRALAAPAWQGPGSWRERLRVSLGVLLEFLQERPGVGLLVIVEALGAGPRVLAHRARLLKALAELLDQGRAQLGARRQPPPLTAEGVVGAVFSLIHTRLLESPRPPLAELLNPLMALILTPYLGQAQAARELDRLAPPPRPRAPDPADPLRGLNMRITNRTIRALTVIAEHPGASNREVADRAGVADQGQISKLLARLCSRGLVENTGPAQPAGLANRWRLTAHGEQVQQALQAHTPTTTASQALGA